MFIPHGSIGGLLTHVKIRLQGRGTSLFATWGDPLGPSQGRGPKVDITHAPPLARANYLEGNNVSDSGGPPVFNRVDLESDWPP